MVSDMKSLLPLPSASPGCSVSFLHLHDFGHVCHGRSVMIPPPPWHRTVLIPLSVLTLEHFCFGTWQAA